MTSVSIRRIAENLIFDKLLRPIRPMMRPWLYRRFYKDLKRHADYWNHLTWLGHPIVQAPLDLWTIQETLAEVKPALLIETGTKYGGSALFYCHLFDLMDHGRVITVDICKLHDLRHPRMTCLNGSSVDDGIVAQVGDTVNHMNGPVMVILDSDHSTEHVTKELNAYHRFVTSGSFLMVQDGRIGSKGEPKGPLKSILEFLPNHPEFEVDHERCNRFLVTHHPMGWLRKRMEPQLTSEQPNQ